MIIATSNNLFIQLQSDLFGKLWGWSWCGTTCRKVGAMCSQLWLSLISSTCACCVNGRLLLHVRVGRRLQYALGGWDGNSFGTRLGKWVEAMWVWTLHIPEVYSWLQLVPKLCTEMHTKKNHRCVSLDSRQQARCKWVQQEAGIPPAHTKGKAHFGKNPKIRMQ